MQNHSFIKKSMTIIFWSLALTVLCLGILPSITPKENFNVKIIAHRGNSSEAPENTSAAFFKAEEVNADFIEFDVHLTKDGVPVVIHDLTLDRTTNTTKPTSLLNARFNDIRDLDAGSWFGDAYQGQVIPTLEEVLTLPINVGMLVEIKPYTAPADELAFAVAEALIRTDHARKNRPLIVGSMSPDVLSELRALVPDQAIIAIVETMESYEGHQKLNPDLYAINKSLVTPDLIAKIHSQGKEVWTWTVDEKGSMRHMAKLGIDGIITNVPRQVNDNINCRKTAPDLIAELCGSN